MQLLPRLDADGFDQPRLPDDDPPNCDLPMMDLLILGCRIGLLMVCPAVAVLRCTIVAAGNVGDCLRHLTAVKLVFLMRMSFLNNVAVADDERNCPRR